MFWLCGFNNILIDIAENKSEISLIGDLVMNFQREFLLEICKTPCDGVWFMDDWGTQQGLMIHPDMWRKLFKFSYKELFDIVHESGKNLFFHTDKQVQEILADLIEIGADALNIQLHLMDLKNVREITLGKCVLVGGLDIQNILPFGTVKDVQSHTKEMISSFKNHYIGQVIIDSGIPLENARMVCETVCGP